MGMIDTDDNDDRRNNKVQQRARVLPATSRMNEIECGFIGLFPM